MKFGEKNFATKHCQWHLTGLRILPAGVTTFCLLSLSKACFSFPFLLISFFIWTVGSEHSRRIRLPWEVRCVADGTRNEQRYWSIDIVFLSFNKIIGRSIRTTLRSAFFYLGQEMKGGGNEWIPLSQVPARQGQLRGLARGHGHGIMGMAAHLLAAFLKQVLLE